MLTWIHGTWSRHATGLLVATLIGLYALRGETVEIKGPDSSGRSRAADDATGKRRRIREGDTLEAELGEFQEDGKRVRFYLLSNEETSFVAVENLALERIAKVLDENTSPRTWSVYGVVTEYRGENYLIVTRAALKARNKRNPTSPRN